MNSLLNNLSKYMIRIDLEGYKLKVELASNFYRAILKEIICNNLKD